MIFFTLIINSDDLVSNDNNKNVTTTYMKEAVIDFQGPIILAKGLIQCIWLTHTDLFGC